MEDVDFNSMEIDSVNRMFDKTYLILDKNNKVVDEFNNEILAKEYIIKRPYLRIQKL